jgi:hypothetical protein
MSAGNRVCVFWGGGRNHTIIMLLLLALFCLAWITIVPPCW